MPRTKESIGGDGHDKIPSMIRASRGDVRLHVAHLTQVPCRVSESDYWRMGGLTADRFCLSALNAENIRR